MATGFRGSSSGSGGSLFDNNSYFDVPKYTFDPYEYTPLGSSSLPSTSNDGGSNNTMLNIPVDYSQPTINPDMYGSSIMDRIEGPPMLSEPGYFSKDSLTQEDIDTYMADTAKFVYNPDSGEFEAAGDYTYPLTKIAPGYSNMQQQFTSGIKPGMTGQQLRDIELNRLNTQKLAFEVPMGEGLNMYDNYNTAYTGFTPDGEFVGSAAAGNQLGPVFDYNNDGIMEPAPGNPAFVPANPKPVEQFQGSVFDEGGAFNPVESGGDVPAGGKGG